MERNNTITEIFDGIAIITMNRPNKLNALNRETIDELHYTLKEISLKKSAQVIIITGAGEKAFVAGADITEFKDFNVEQASILARSGHQKLFNYIESSSIPIIAAINGFALGGGLELALAAHLRVASLNAKFGLPEVSLGLIPGYGGTQRLTQLVGKGRSIEMIISGQMIDSKKATEWGLVNTITDPESLIDECISLAKVIKSNSPLAIAAAIRAINANFKDRVNGYDTEILEFSKCFGTDDFREGISAFLQKRKAKFTGN
tara:strand:+ start:1468 stop:2250 length:783 start_codon:yes stop_codon:yes gene_type:complete